MKIIYMNLQEHFSYTFSGLGSLWRKGAQNVKNLKSSDIKVEKRQNFIKLVEGQV